MSPLPRKLDARVALKVLLSVAALLLVLHGVTVWLMFDGARILGLGFDAREVLNADVEGSITSWWQQWQLGAAALLALLVGLEITRGPAGENRRRVWLGLSGVLLLMSLDEAVALHEHLITPMRHLLHVHSGLLFFAWVVPGAIAVAVLALIAYRNRGAFPAPGRSWMLLGAVLFFVGALGLEMIGGAYESARGQDYGYFVEVAVEEGLEMVGEALVLCGIYAVLLSLALVGERGEPQLVE